jgi:hypothetical protein
MVETLADVRKGMTSFMVRMFVTGFILGIAGSVLYGYVGTSTDKFFHSFIIFAGFAFTFPMFTISVRLMLKMFYMSVEATENQSMLIDKVRRVEEAAGPVVDKVKEILTVHADPAVKKIEHLIEKAGPIIDNVEIVVQKSKGMAEDIEQIAHRIRNITEAMNGHFDFKNIDQKLDKVADSLSTIASVFDPPKKKTASTNGENTPAVVAAGFPAFDPLTTGRKK